MTAMFGLLMKGPAQIWHSILPEATRNSWSALREAFLDRFLSSVNIRDVMQQLWTAKQNPDEPVRDYIDRVSSIALDVNIETAELICAITSGLKPAIKQFVSRQPEKPQTIASLTEAAALAEQTDFTSNCSSQETYTDIHADSNTTST